MEYSLLQDLIEKPSSGEWGTGTGDIKVIRTANFTNHGRIDFTEIVTRDISDKKVQAKKLHREDIIIEKSGGSPAQPVGRVVFFDREGTYLCNNFTSVLRPIKSKVVPKYLHYILFSNHKYRFVEKFQNKTTGIINLQLPKYIQNTKIPLPPLPEQQKIAAILDAADQLRQKNQQLIEHYTRLGQALFLEMFGDPVGNPMRWEIKPLSAIATSQLGKMLSKKSQQNINPKKYLRNANVRWRHFKLEDMLTMDFNDKEIAKFDLLPGDLLVCEGGEVGRCAIWRNNLEDCYFQKALHRVRVNKNALTSEYLQEYFFWMSKLGGLVSSVSEVTFSHLTAEKLKRLNIPLPPITLQNQFAQHIEAIDQQKQYAQASLEKSESLFNSLLQRAFKGELTG